MTYDATENEWVDVTIVKLTKQAVLVSTGKLQEWVPRSLIVDEEDTPLTEGMVTRIEVPKWFLEERDLP